jgi:fructose-1,6-bisphosphatase/inositol monophosphatase family enzyme
MDPAAARHFSIDLCNIVYRRISQLPRQERTGILNSSSEPDVIWKPDLTAFLAIRKYLENTGISFRLISESGKVDNEDPEIVVIADELEGTRNFKDRSGPFAISIAISKKINPHPHMLGVAILVKDSWGRRIYSADDKRAYNGDEILDCTDKQLENSSIAIGDYHTDMQDAKLLPIEALYGIKNKKPLNPLTETATGSHASAIDLCYCADPKVGVVGYIDLRGLQSRASSSNHGIRPFDIVAPVHILECAGGKATDASGQELKYDFKSEPILTMIAGSNEKIHRDLLVRIRKVLKKAD